MYEAARPVRKSGAAIFGRLVAGERLEGGRHRGGERLQRAAALQQRWVPPSSCGISPLIQRQTTAAAGRRRPQSRALRMLSIFCRTVLRFLCLRSYASTVLRSTSDKLGSRELMSLTPRSS